MGRSLLFASIVTTSTLLLLVADTGGAGRAVGVGVHDATAAPGCGRGCQTFKLQMIFTQHRPWTRHYQQVSDTDPICIRTEEGNGSDEIRMRGTGRLILPRAGRPSVTLSGATGVEIRSGVETSNVAGASCAPSAVFPSTWSIVTQIDGSVSASAPTTGCGRQPIIQFPNLEFSGNRIRLHWTSNGKVPEFKSCPFFDGANEASEGNQLPKGDLFDVTAKVGLNALRNASRRRVTASGVARLGATETCANLQEPCGQGISYTATGSVEGTVQFVFVRQRP